MVPKSENQQQCAIWSSIHRETSLLRVDEKNSEMIFMIPDLNIATQSQWKECVVIKQLQTMKVSKQSFFFPKKPFYKRGNPIVFMITPLLKLTLLLKSKWKQSTKNYYSRISLFSFSSTLFNTGWFHFTLFIKSVSSTSY